VIAPDPRFGTPTLLQGESQSKRGGGNLLLVYGEGDARGLLKVYRRRGGARQEALKRVGFKLLERKRGVTAKERRELERRNLELWRSHDFDVPALLDRPIPEAFAGEPALWLEFCPGPTLWDRVCDAGVPLPARCVALARGAAELSRRQGLALAMGERDLVMKHGSLKHILVHGSRQVSFDLEGGYATTMPLLDALCDELSGYIRSLQRGPAPEELRDLGEAFARGYGARDQLREIAAYGASHRSLRRTVKRWDDRRRRGTGAKASGLLWLLELSGG
jgi:hypothetical protein